MARKRSRGQKTRKTMGFNEFKDKRGKSTEAIRHITSEERAVTNRVQRCAKDCLHTTAFEYTMGAIILSNIFVMIVEIDRAANDEDISSDEVHWTDTFGWVVLFIFAVELLIRLFAFRRTFWMDPWNVFDFVIVSVDGTVFLLTLIFGKVFPVAMLRMFRLAKLARVSKVLRVFPELRLLLASLLNAIFAIFWGAILLGLILLGWSMAAVLFINPLNRELDYGVIHGGSCERCPYAYSSVTHSMLTFWSSIVCGDSWGKTTIPLIEQWPSTSAFFIPQFLTVGMAVVSLILGLVVSVAQDAKDDIKEVDNAQATAAKFEKQSNLLKLCKQMDVDRSGEVSQEELLQAFEEPGEFRDSMECLGITRDDFDVVWALLDSENSGSVCYKRLVSRLYSMKTSDASFTLAYLKYHVTLIRDSLQQLEEKIEEDVKEEEKIEEELHKVEASENRLVGKVEELLLNLTGGAMRQGASLQSALSEKEHHSEEDGGKLQEAASRITQGPSRQQKLLQKVREKSVFQVAEQAGKNLEYDLLEADEEVSEAVKSEGSQTREAVDETLDDLSEWIDKQNLSTDLNGSQGETSAIMTDEPQLLLSKVCRHIDRLRLDIKDKIEEEFHIINKKEELLLERMEGIFKKLQVVGHAAPGEEILEAAVFGEILKAEVLEIAVNEDVFEATRGEEPQAQVAAKQTPNGLHKHLSAELNGSKGETSATKVDETKLLLRKVCRDIDGLRSELKDVLWNVDRRLGSGEVPSSGRSLVAMEREVIRTEAELDLLVIPENASCSSSRCDCNKPSTEISNSREKL